MVNKDERESEKDKRQSHVVKARKRAARIKKPHDSEANKSYPGADANSDSQSITGVSQPPEQFKHWRRLFQYVIPSITGILTLVILTFQLRIYHQHVEELRLDRRAWMAIDRITGIPETGKPLQFLVGITNTGRTFARNVDEIVIGKSMAKGTIPDFAAEIRKQANERSKREVSQTLAAPNSQSDIPLQNLTDPDAVADVTALKDGSQKMFIFGQITYDDIFDHHHWLTFCATIDYSAKRSENSGWDYLNYSHYNDTGDGSPPAWKAIPQSNH